MNKFLEWFEEFDDRHPFLGMLTFVGGLSTAIILVIVLLAASLSWLTRSKGTVTYERNGVTYSIKGEISRDSHVVTIYGDNGEITRITENCVITYDE